MGLNNRTLKFDWHTPQQNRGARSPTPRPLRGGQRGSPAGKGLARKSLRSRGRARRAGPTAPGWIRNIGHFRGRREGWLPALWTRWRRRWFTAPEERRLHCWATGSPGSQTKPTPPCPLLWLPGAEASAEATPDLGCIAAQLETLHWLWDPEARLWGARGARFRGRGGALKQGLLGAAVSSPETDGSRFILLFESLVTRRVPAGPEVFQWT